MVSVFNQQLLAKKEPKEAAMRDMDTCTTASPLVMVLSQAF